MMLNQYKAFRSVIRTGSFFLTLIFFGVTTSAAEVTRSLSLEDRIRILEQQLSSANRMRAESQFEITNLKNEVRELRGLVEEQGYQLQQIITRQREFYRDIDQRLGQATTNTATSATTQTQNNVPATIPQEQNTAPIINNSGSVVASSLPDSTIEPDTSSTDSSVDDAQVRGIYDKIFPLVRSKRYDDAIAGYQHFIAQYPDSIYVANSRYWLAQIYSVQGRADEAEREYLSVAQQYASSAKAPDAWLKLGQLYERKGENDKALNAYNQVVTEYANSTAAQMAVNRLQSLKSGN